MKRPADPTFGALVVKISGSFDQEMIGRNGNHGFEVAVVLSDLVRIERHKLLACNRAVGKSGLQLRDGCGNEVDTSRHVGMR